MNLIAPYGKADHLLVDIEVVNRYRRLLLLLYIVAIMNIFLLYGQAAHLLAHTADCSVLYLTDDQCCSNPILDAMLSMILLYRQTIHWWITCCNEDSFLQCYDSATLSLVALCIYIF